MWACLVYVIQCVNTVRLTHMLYAAESMHVCVRLPQSVYVHHICRSEKKYLSCILHKAQEENDLTTPDRC